MKSLVVVVALLLVGCQSSPVFYHRDPARQIVVLDKREMSLIPLGENRWEVYGGRDWGMKPDLNVQKARQVAAVEKVTGCRVVNAQFVPGHEVDGMLLHATVNCAK